MISPQDSWLDSCADILKAQEFVDLVIKCDNKEFIQAHRMILAARSSVFRRMLLNGMRESSGKVSLPFSKQAVQALINFIYLVIDPFMDKALDLGELLRLNHAYDISNLNAHTSSVAMVKAVKENGKNWRNLEYE